MRKALIPLVLIASSAALVAVCSVMSSISPALEKSLDPKTAPYVFFTGLYMGAGLVFLVGLGLLVRLCPNRRLVLMTLALGVIMRLVFLPSTPIIEDDYHRYFWDGALVAHGKSPYAYSPEQLLVMQESVPEDVRELAREGKRTLERINHPELRTIYPPVAQAVFGVAYLLAPYDIFVWRLILLLFDSAVAITVLMLLKQLGRSPLWLSVYWCNPIVAKEFTNALHMDLIALLPLAVGLLLSMRGKPLWATVAISIAAGVKIWPALLLPLVWRPLLRRDRTALCTLAVCLGTAVLILGALTWPIVASRLDTSSAFVRYAESWQNNDGLFRLLRLGVEVMLPRLGLEMGDLDLWVRRVVGLLLCLWMTALAFHRAADTADLSRRFLLAIAGVFLLSPTEFPWYYAWLLPFLPLCPSWALLAYTALIPLYELQYFFEAFGDMQTFSGLVVWLEHVPVWIWIAIELKRRQPPWFPATIARER